MFPSGTSVDPASHHVTAYMPIVVVEQVLNGGLHWRTAEWKLWKNIYTWKLG